MTRMNIMVSLAMIPPMLIADDCSGSCREASAFIEKALGQRELEIITPEFYQSTPQSERAEQREYPTACF